MCTLWGLYMNVFMKISLWTCCVFINLNNLCTGIVCFSKFIQGVLTGIFNSCYLCFYTLHVGCGTTICNSGTAEGVFALHNVALFRNPVEELAGGTVALGWRSPLWCCDWLLKTTISSSIYHRLAYLAPACVLLRWLGDMQTAQGFININALQLSWFHTWLSFSSG